MLKSIKQEIAAEQKSRNSLCITINCQEKCPILTLGCSWVPQTLLSLDRCSASGGRWTNHRCFII